MVYHNDPVVYSKLIGTPFPYTQEDAESWFPIIERGCREGLGQYRELLAQREKGEQGGWVDAGAPVRSIREVNPETGEQTFIGDCGIQRGPFREIVDQEEKERLVKENEGWEAGDERIVWEIGSKFLYCFLCFILDVRRNY